MVEEKDETSYVAFQGDRRLAAGDLASVARVVKPLVDSDPGAEVLIFDDATGKVVDVDFRGSADEVAQRLAPPPAAEEAPSGRGRPKLGVVPREVTLLPRHWDWLAQQPGGASVALRKLVEEARKANREKDRKRQAQEATARFLTVLGGNRAGFEEATRALYAGNQARFDEMIDAWPADVKEHAKQLSAAAFAC